MIQEFYRIERKPGEYLARNGRYYYCFAPRHSGGTLQFPTKDQAAKASPQDGKPVKVKLITN